MAPTIDVRDLSYSYFKASTAALTSCTFTVPGGQCYALLGPTGAGKSTVLQVLSGIGGSQITTALASGSLTMGDRRFSPIPTQNLFPFVGYFLPDPLIQISGIKETVTEEIAFTLDNIGIPEPDRSARVDMVMHQMRLSHLAHRHPHDLSGGEIQRVALASLLVAQPPVLLLDDPVNALDASSQQNLAGVVRSLKGRCTIIIADHQVDFAVAVADRIAVMDKGAIIFDGTRREFLRSLRRFEHLLPVRFRSELAASTTAQRPLIQRLLFP